MKNRINIMERAVQDIYAPNSTCFGCGPANEKGLRIKSFWEGDECILRYRPKEEHQAFPGAINGGIIGTLFDCHMNWCATTALYNTNQEMEFPSTVTSEFKIQFKRPSPYGVELVIKAKPIEINEKFVKVEAYMYANDKITAIGYGTFVAVSEGHPAYHRWI